MGLFHCFLIALLAPVALAGPLKNFGTGVSNGRITSQEQTLLNYTLSIAGNWGVTTHFWITGDAPQCDTATIRYYVDGEATASVEFQPQHASGVAFDDATNVWGTRWAGKGSTTGGFFHAYRVPFYKNLVVTYTLAPGQKESSIFIQVRGVENLPLDLGGGLSAPTGETGTPRSRMVVQRRNVTMQPLDYLNIVDVPAGSQGLVFQTMLSFSAPTMNTLEGCVRWYGRAAEPFPGVLLGTGTEDFFDSSHYFSIGDNATHFHLPGAGLTHFVHSGKDSFTAFSAYKFQDMDPLVFADGGRLQWRNGDVFDESNRKCFLQHGGHTIGHPGVAQVLTYAWVYVW